MLGDLGYPGLILFVLNLGTAFWSCWVVRRRTIDRPDLRDLRIYADALTSALAVYAVTGSFLSHHYNEMAWHLFALTAALRLIAADSLNSLPATEATSKAA